MLKYEQTTPQADYMMQIQAGLATSKRTLRPSSNLNIQSYRARESRFTSGGQCVHAPEVSFNIHG